MIDDHIPPEGKTHFNSTQLKCPEGFKGITDYNDKEYVSCKVIRGDMGMFITQYKHCGDIHTDTLLHFDNGMPIKCSGCKKFIHLKV